MFAGLRGICAAKPSSAWLAREIRSRREAEPLVILADAGGYLWRKTLHPGPDTLTGGEHLVEIDTREGLVFKITHPGKFGFGVDLEMTDPPGWNQRPSVTASLVDGTPIDYLLRIGWQNEHFGDDIRVLGVAQFPQGVSILTTQPFYRGERTEQALIDSFFEERGWKMMSWKPGAYFHAELDLLALDALPRNVLTLQGDELMPFDVVMVKPEEMLKSKLEI